MKERKNWSKMQTGMVCFLDVSTDVISDRVGSGEGRPLLEGGDVKGKLDKIIQERRDMYEQADVIVKVEDPNEDIDTTCQRLVKQVSAISFGWGGPVANAPCGHFLFRFVFSFVSFLFSVPFKTIKLNPKPKQQRPTPCLIVVLPKFHTFIDENPPKWRKALDEKDSEN